MFKKPQLSLTDFQNKKLTAFQDDYKNAKCPTCKTPLKVNAIWREGEIVVLSGYCMVHGSCCPEEIVKS
jgi:hypothetical protein